MITIQNELSRLFHIAIALIAVSVVCGVIFFGLSQSRDIADKGLAAMLETNKTSQLEAVQTFTKWQGKSIPAAACYSLLKENTEIITNLTCSICGKITTGADIGDCFKSHMTGRIRITLTEEESGGTYTAVLSAG